MPKKAIKIELSKEEDTIIYNEKTLGKNITIQKNGSALLCFKRSGKYISDL